MESASVCKIVLAQDFNDRHLLKVTNSSKCLYELKWNTHFFLFTEKFSYDRQFSQESSFPDVDKFREAFFRHFWMIHIRDQNVVRLFPAK